MGTAAAVRGAVRMTPVRSLELLAMGCVLSLAGRTKSVQWSIQSLRSGSRRSGIRSAQSLPTAVDGVSESTGHVERCAAILTPRCSMRARLTGQPLILTTQKLCRFRPTSRTRRTQTSAACVVAVTQRVAQVYFQGFSRSGTASSKKDLKDAHTLDGVYEELVETS